MLGTLVLISVALIAQPNSSEKLPNAGAKKGIHKKMNPDGRRAQGDRMANYLELSDAQKTKMKALKLEQQKILDLREKQIIAINRFLNKPFSSEFKKWK